MNTLARQPISQTFANASIAAILLVTCLNTQAADSNVNQDFHNFRSETMTSIHADLRASDFSAPTLGPLNAAVESAIQSENYRTETLGSISAQLQSNNSITPSLDLLNAALADTHYQSEIESDTLQAAQANSVWTEPQNILPAIASLGKIELETKDAVSREATMLAINFAISALENAKSNLVNSQQLTL